MMTPQQRTAAADKALQRYIDDLPYNMARFDEHEPSSRRMERGEGDDCYTDAVIPTRPRNRMRRMVRLYGEV